MNRVLTIAHSEKEEVIKGIADKSWGPVLFGMMVCALITMGTIPSAVHAFPTAHWEVGVGEHLEVLRDFVCFDEARAGERSMPRLVDFSHPVLSAEVFLSGFNLWYPGKNDHEVTQERVDAWIEQIGVCDPDGGSCNNRRVYIRLTYVMKDEDTRQSDDFNRACIGFTVLARTK